MMWVWEASWPDVLEVIVDFNPIATNLSDFNPIATNLYILQLNNSLHWRCCGWSSLYSNDVLCKCYRIYLFMRMVRSRQCWLLIFSLYSLINIHVYNTFTRTKWIFTKKSLQANSCGVQVDDISVLTEC